jgi:DNA invertase Pin-like site-specific DNA recombinase
VVDTKSATGKLILTIFAGFAQFEREMMLERQREGIAKARAENRYLGRRPSARLKADEAVKLFKAGRTVTQIANDLGIGRGSLYRALEPAAKGKQQARCLLNVANDQSRRILFSNESRAGASFGFRRFRVPVFSACSFGT